MGVICMLPQSMNTKEHQLEDVIYMYEMIPFHLINKLPQKVVFRGFTKTS